MADEGRGRGCHVSGMKGGEKGGESGRSWWRGSCDRRTPGLVDGRVVGFGDAAGAAAGPKVLF